MPNQIIRRYVAIIGITSMLTACQTTFIAPKIAAVTLADSSVEAPILNWLTTFNDATLQQLIDSVAQHNFNLQESAARMAAAQQQTIINGAARWPDAGINSSAKRQKIATNNYAETYGVNFDIAWEVDLWGKISDTNKSGLFTYQAQQQNYKSVRLSVIANTAKQWFEVISQNQLLTLLEQRVKNLNDNLDIIESGYRQGINSSLDVYLSRSDLASEKSQLYGQKNALEQSSRTLQILLGQFPDGEIEQLSANNTLPVLTASLPTDISSKVVYLRPDIQEAFYTLQAADRDVAIAYKARFPSFNLTASAGDSSDEFKSLFDQSSLAWSIIGSLVQPVFSGGRLKATQAKKEFELRQREQNYLSVLHDAYFELFTFIDNETVLTEQLSQLKIAKENAEAAEKLAFNEYEQGLSEYTSVLESQRRAFSAQTNTINTHNQLLQNRINFFLATGAEY
jgi:multidrug efflux system outer membrane protein